MSEFQCPKCGSMDLTQGRIIYDGCCTDEERYGKSMDWRHDGFQCKVCKTKFTVWDEYDEFTLDK